MRELNYKLIPSYLSAFNFEFKYAKLFKNYIQESVVDVRESSK